MHGTISPPIMTSPVIIGCGGGCYGGCVGGMPGVMPSVSNAGKIVEGTLAAKSGSEKNFATVEIKADKDVAIKVNGTATPRKQIEETFKTPELQVGRTYSYSVVAEAMRNGVKVSRTKEITVRAGENTVVDFVELDKADAVEARTPEDKSKFARLTVALPKNAKLFVNNVAIKAEGTQTFTTPELAPGKTFYYTVKVELERDGKNVEDKRQVEVVAGKEVKLDFTADTTVTASR
jgi:uncharacterized protein (TIGR03000 family)